MKEHAEAHEEELIRVLVIGRDQLIRSGRRYEVDFIPTGRSDTPDAPLGYAPTFLTRLEYLWGLIRGQYRLALLAAPASGSIAERLLRLRPSVFLLQKLRFGSTHLALLDTGDSAVLPEAALIALRPDTCWKLHLTDPGQPLHGSTALHLLPRWVYPPPAGWSRTPWKQREIDLLLPPGPDHSARRVVLQWLAHYRKTSRLKIRIVEAETGERELHELLGRSRLVLTPVGEGLHQPRHYQAMLHGALPVINESGTTLQTTLAHGENCLFYQENEASLRAVLDWAAEHPESVEILARQARQHAWEHHTPIAISRTLLQTAGLPTEE